MTLPAKHLPQSALAGIVLISLAFFFFAVTSAIAKTVLSTYSVGQMLMIRSIVALILLSPFIIHEARTAFRLPNPKLQLVRAVVSVIDVTMFFWAISYLQIADAVAIYLSGPLFVTLWSALFLGEQVRWRRWTAVLVGFVGVLIALRPSAATISLPALIALVGTMLYAFGVLATRALRGTTDIALTTTQMVAALTYGSLTLLLPHGWITPTPADFAILVLIGFPTAIGYVCLNRALKVAPASVVAPYQYTLIIWAALFGYLMFGDVPPVTTVIGAAIIVSAGLYISWRERVLGKTPPPPVAEPV